MILMKTESIKFYFDRGDFFPFQEQDKLLKKEQGISRKPLIENLVKSSSEISGTQFIQDSLIPNLKNASSDIQKQASLLQIAMEKAAPVLKDHVFGSCNFQQTKSEFLKAVREV
jgi:hypothetical protein